MSSSVLLSLLWHSSGGLSSLLYNRFYIDDYSQITRNHQLTKVFFIFKKLSSKIRLIYSSSHQVVWERFCSVRAGKETKETYKLPDNSSSISTSPD